MANRMAPNYDNETELLLSDQNTLRKLVGILGVLLPFLLIGVLLVDTHWPSPLYSISHYYYTRAAGVFVTVMSLLAIFLIIYKGKERKDFWLSTLAGFFALCVVLFPTNNLSGTVPDHDRPYLVTVLKLSDFRVIFHYTSAAIFLLCLAALSLFVFTLSDKKGKERGKQKINRNRVYTTCGLIMIAAVGIIFCGTVLRLIPEDVYDQNHITFWMETLAVESFGVAWLIKGGVALRDKIPSTTKVADPVLTAAD